MIHAIDSLKLEVIDVRVVANPQFETFVVVPIDLQLKKKLEGITKRVYLAQLLTSCSYLDPAMELQAEIHTLV